MAHLQEESALMKKLLVGELVMHCNSFVEMTEASIKTLVCQKLLQITCSLLQAIRNFWLPSLKF